MTTNNNPPKPDVAGVPERCGKCGHNNINPNNGFCVEWADRKQRRCGCKCILNVASQPATTPNNDVDDLHLAICQAVALMNQGDLHGGHDLLRQTLVDFADKKAPLSRSEIIRQQQRASGGEVTAVMVSPNVTTPLDVTERARRAALRLKHDADDQFAMPVPDEPIVTMWTAVIAAEFEQGE